MFLDSCPSVPCMLDFFLSGCPLPLVKKRPGLIKLFCKAWHAWGWGNFVNLRDPALPSSILDTAELTHGTESGYGFVFKAEQNMPEGLNDLENEARL